MNKSPLELLAAELGSDVARLQRELRLEVALIRAEIKQELEVLRATRAETELHIVNAVRAATDALHQKLLMVRDGEDGAPGVRGTQFVSGNGAPDIADALEGDLYLDLDTGDIHKFIS